MKKALATWIFHWVILGDSNLGISKRLIEVDQNGEISDGFCRQLDNFEWSNYNRTFSGNEKATILKKILKCLKCIKIVNAQFKVILLNLIIKKI